MEDILYVILYVIMNRNFATLRVYIRPAFR